MVVKNGTLYLVLRSTTHTNAIQAIAVAQEEVDFSPQTPYLKRGPEAVLKS